MKTGKSISELAAEIDRQQNAKRDLVADTRALTMLGGNKETGPMLAVACNRENQGGEDSMEMFHVKRHAHTQIAQRLDIPQAYYDRMVTDAPDLLAKNVNTWFEKQPERRMVRLLDSGVRAFLSEKYRPLDNYDLLQAALPALTQIADMQIVSCEVTDRRMYLKALFPRIQSEVTKGDVVQSGLVISNSEVGAGSLRIEPLIFRLVCLNGMIAESAMKKYHVGRGGSNDEDSVYEVLTDRTKELTDAAVWAQVRDVIASSVKADLFEGHVERLRLAARNELNGNPLKVVEVTTKRLRLSEGESSDILKHLISGGSLTQWGLANAITRTAQDVPDYDRATELERLGGRVIELAPKDWAVIAEAA